MTLAVLEFSTYIRVASASESICSKMLLVFFCVFFLIIVVFVFVLKTILFPTWSL